MEISYRLSALTGEIEHLLVKVFNTVSLSDFLTSKILVAGFRKFVERGTREDLLELLPNIQSKYLVNLNDVPNLLGTTSTKDLPPSSHRTIQASPQLAADSLSSTPSTSIAEHLTTQAQSQETTQVTPNYIVRPQPTADSFSSILSAQTPSDDTKRLKNIIRAIEAFNTATTLPLESYTRLWSAKEEIFVGNESGLKGWMCRLQRGRKKLVTDVQTIGCASRLSLMLVSQFVHYTEQRVGLPLQSGHSRRSVALESAVRDCEVPLKTLKGDIRKASNYFYLLEKAGPGYLLELGSKVTNLWEKDLSQSDIDIILAYIEKELPERKKRANSLNGPGARALRACLVACGWTSEALETCTRLINSIKQHENGPNPVEITPSRKRSHDNDCIQLPTRLKLKDRQDKIRLVVSPLVKDERSTYTSTSAESSSMQSMAIGRLPFELDMNQGASVSTPNPAVEGTCQDQLIQNVSMQPPAVVPGPNESIYSTSYPPCQDLNTHISGNNDDELGLMDGYENAQDDGGNTAQYNPTTSPGWPNGWNGDPPESFQQYYHNPFLNLDQCPSYFAGDNLHLLFPDVPETP